METLYNLKISVFQLTVLILFISSFLIQIGYYLIIFRRMVVYKPSSLPTDQSPVSVIICSQDQGHYLEENLEHFLCQDYPTYEIVIVDDCSTDQTEMVVTRFKQQYPHLRSTIIKPDPKFRHNIKLAITIGIKAAKYDQILLSSPFCRPASRHWLKNMQANFGTKDTLVQGYANIPRCKGFLSQLIRYDNFFETFKRYSFALSGKSYAGTGNNMGYCKSHFLTQKGFARNAHIPHGFDHLMIHNLGQTGTASICCNARGKVEIRHRNQYQNWIDSYQNYLGSRQFFTNKLRLLLDLEPISRMIFHISFFFLLIPNQILILTSSLYLLRLIIFLCFIKITASHLKEEKLFLSSYINDILVLFLKLYLYIKINVFKRSK